MAGRIDLNADIGEGFPYDDQLLQIITSANVCCGSHAGSTLMTEDTIKKCHRAHVRVGAHPGYADRENFGRKSVELTSDAEKSALFRSLIGQLDRFKEDWKYLKPHGGLYHDVGADESHAGILTALLVRSELPLMGFPGTLHFSSAKAAGVKFLREGFADRRYGSDGKLVPRSQPDAMLTDEAEIREQVLRLASEVGSICLHGDGDHCVEIAKLVRTTLEDAGWTLGT